MEIDTASLPPDKMKNEKTTQMNKLMEYKMIEAFKLLDPSLQTREDVLKYARASFNKKAR